MSDYIPIYEGCVPSTHTTSAAVVGGKLVAVSGDGTVAHAGANAGNWVGAAAFDAASGARVTVHRSGIQSLVASGAITAGDLVVCGATGTVASLAAVTTPTAADVTNSRGVVGVALTTAADTAAVRVLMAR
jgi:hypothetical protein